VSKTPMTDEVERFHSYGRLHNHAMELERALNECEAALRRYQIHAEKIRPGHLDPSEMMEQGHTALATVAKLREKYK